ncbi:hypothetical protein O181_058444 [Austropuccinia psidii MF-1]|uniref:Peptidase M3A/M3B catalytic domain-containing protein n=1 Tax=Austropuccinia psidii MF-1 TaxID=1389203 RepID=A0A9Q3ECC1_9BASI|nr:hypothetical protein [Austropuccinia psidii MF-1]
MRISKLLISHSRIGGSNLNFKFFTKAIILLNSHHSTISISNLSNQILLKNSPIQHLNNSNIIKNQNSSSNHTCKIQNNLLFSNFNQFCPSIYSKNSSTNSSRNLTMSHSSSTPIPPQSPPIWDHTPEQIISITNQAINSSKQKLDKIANLSHHHCNFQSVVIPLAQNDLITILAETLTFYQYVSPNDSIRQAAIEADKLLQQHNLHLNSRVDLYNALLSAKENSNLESLDHESRRLFDKLLIDRTQNGLHLHENDRKKFNELKQEINDLTIDFQKNLNEENGKIWFTVKELEGVPEDVLSGFEKSQDGKLAMTFKTPDVVPVTQYAINPETRKKVSLGFDSKAAINIPILNKILSLRRQAAQALGKENWAQHSLQVKMAKNPKTVMDFLQDLREKLTPIGQKEREELLKLKRQQVKELNLDIDPDRLYVWDYRYYDRLYTEKKLDLKAELIKEYFPVAVVVQVILEIYQSLLSVKFFKVQDAKLWHPNVSQWAVWDSEAIEDGSAQEGNGFLGYLHLDLEPRPNKYGHAAVWGLIPGYEKDDGSRNYPVAAMVANLAKETSQKPALLTHDSVVTFFHEMGHAFHQLCSKTKYARFHGTNVARDFVEAPSQMLENWCWTEAQLLKMSQHYERSGEKLPKELIEKIIASRDINSGLANLRQIFFGMFDMFVHTTAKDDADLTDAWCQMRSEISLLDSREDGKAPGQSSFGHIVGGYDAGYYGYLYSQVFSTDMYESEFAKDPMSKEIGMRYREEILKPGGSREEMESLIKFLGGRKPNNEAFMKRLLKNQ